MSSKAKIRSETVKHLTYFVVQAFQATKGGGITADEPRQARDQQHALHLLERYRSVRAGAVAFRRTGDPSTGDWEDAVIIARFGRVPGEVDALKDESDADFETWDLSERDLKVA